MAKVRIEITTKGQQLSRAIVGNIGNQQVYLVLVCGFKFGIVLSKDGCGIDEIPKVKVVVVERFGTE